MIGRLPPVQALLPHGHPARLVDSVIAVRDDAIECVVRVPEDSAFAEGGRAPAWLGFEMGAQAAATLEAVSRVTGGAAADPRVGYLVSVKDATLHAGFLPVGRPLVARVEKVEGTYPLTIYRATVRDAERVLVEGTIGTYIAG